MTGMKRDRKPLPAIPTAAPVAILTVLLFASLPALLPAPLPAPLPALLPSVFRSSRPVSRPKGADHPSEALEAASRSLVEEAAVRFSAEEAAARFPGEEAAARPPAEEAVARAQAATNYITDSQSYYCKTSHRKVAGFFKKYQKAIGLLGCRSPASGLRPRRSRRWPGPESQLRWCRRW